MHISDVSWLLGKNMIDTSSLFFSWRRTLCDNVKFFSEVDMTRRIVPRHQTCKQTRCVHQKPWSIRLFWTPNAAIGCPCAKFSPLALVRINHTWLDIILLSDNSSYIFHTFIIGFLFFNFWSFFLFQVCWRSFLLTTDWLVVRETGKTFRQN